MPRQTSMQLTAATERQIDALKAEGYGSTTDIIRIAIDRMYQQEVYTMSTPEDRTAQVNELRQIADAISHYDAVDATAEHLVETWEQLADAKPDWFTDFDRQLLVRFVSEIIA